MGLKTKIDWCDSSWNPVTGCLHDCTYCYARGIAHRFGGNGDRETHVVETRQYKDGTWTPNPYPFGFAPTLHKYLLHVPLKWKKQRTIFVCSMSDLFGTWVPDEWIKAIFDACAAAPQHRYLFLTKNPHRYIDLMVKDLLPKGDNLWFGTTVTTPESPFLWNNNRHTFLSIEPILKSFSTWDRRKPLPDWVIIGAETGNRKGKVIPEKEWIDKIVADWKRFDRPVFMKESLRSIMGEDFRQEFPWEANRDG